MCLMLPPVSWHRKAGLEPYLFVVGLLAGLAPVGNRQSWRFQTSQQQQSSSIRVVSVRPIIPGLERLLKRREVRWRHGGDIHIEPADIDLTMFSSALRKPFRFITIEHGASFSWHSPVICSHQACGLPLS